MTSTAELPRCPQCAAVLPSPRPTLCPSCSYPLVFVEDSPTHDGATELERPTPDPEPADPTPDVPPPPPPPPALGNTAACPHCGFGNAPDRLWCESCGKSTVIQQAPPPPPPPPLPPPPQIPVWVWVVAGVVVVALAVGVFLWARSRPGEPVVTPTLTASTPQSEPPSTPTPTPDPEPTPLAVAKASATSTHPKAAKESYGAGKTIDGNPKTAWNSYGSKVGARAKGVALTWDLEERAQVTAIEIHNGFQTSEKRFKANGRIKAVEIVTEDGAEEFTLDDTMGPQLIEHDFGVTDFVRFRVLSVYRDEKTKFKDLALSEVAFLGYREP